VPRALRRQGAAVLQWHKNRRLVPRRALAGRDAAVAVAAVVVALAAAPLRPVGRGGSRQEAAVVGELEQRQLPHDGRQRRGVGRRGCARGGAGRGRAGAAGAGLKPGRLKQVASQQPPPRRGQLLHRLHLERAAAAAAERGAQRERDARAAARAREAGRDERLCRQLKRRRVDDGDAQPPQHALEARRPVGARQHRAAARRLGRERHEPPAGGRQDGPSAARQQAPVWAVRRLRQPLPQPLDPFPGRSRWAREGWGRLDGRTRVARGWRDSSPPSRDACNPAARAARTR
jgi:hypothetical protein